MERPKTRRDREGFDWRVVRAYTLTIVALVVAGSSAIYISDWWKHGSELTFATKKKPAQCAVFVFLVPEVGLEPTRF